MRVDNIINRLIIESSFKLIFWIQFNSKSSCSHFQLNSSQVEHIFNLMQLDSTENWVNLTWLVKNLSSTSRELNIEIFPTFALSFCIIFLIESHEEKTWRSFDRMLRAYQDWIELVSVSSSDLAQPLFSFTNISLFNIIFLSTSHSTHVTNTFSSSLAQSLNIT